MFSPPFPHSAPSVPALRHAPARRSLALALLIALVPAAANAATIVVTRPDDSDPAASDTCTLRQAIASMNAGTPKGNCVNAGGAFGSNDSITFAASSISGAATPGTVALADSADASGTVGGTLVVSAAHLTIDASAWRGSGAGQYADGVTIARPTGAIHAFGILRDTAATGGSLSLKGVTIHNGSATAGLCSARADGGGICIVAADLTLTDSTISGNQANYAGGGISSATGTLMLNRVTIDGNSAYRGGGFHSGSGSATLTASTVSGNSIWPVGTGGGIDSIGTLTLIDSVVSGNAAKLGGGIQSSGTLSLIRSVVAGNEAYYNGGGIHVLAGGTAIVTGSTISGNTARYDGGGVYSAGVLTVSNSTITGNHNFWDGAGIYSSGTVHLMHATVSANSTNRLGGGLKGNGSATIDHSIVAGNLQSSGGDIDIAEPWTGNDNLISADNLDLGPLQDNGGPTPTMLPGANSAAIDAIAPQDCTESTDQRGVARPQGAGCDIGAVEVRPDGIFADGFDGG